MNLNHREKLKSTASDASSIVIAAKPKVISKEPKVINQIPLAQKNSIVESLDTSNSASQSNKYVQKPIN